MRKTLRKWMDKGQSMSGARCVKEPNKNNREGRVLSTCQFALVHVYPVIVDRSLFKTTPTLHNGLHRAQRGSFDREVISRKGEMGELTSASKETDRLRESGCLERDVALKERERERSFRERERERSFRERERDVFAFIGEQTRMLLRQPLFSLLKLVLIFPLSTSLFILLLQFLLTNEGQLHLSLRQKLKAYRKGNLEHIIICFNKMDFQSLFYVILQITKGKVSGLESSVS